MPPKGSSRRLANRELAQDDDYNQNDFIPVSDEEEERPTFWGLPESQNTIFKKSSCKLYRALETTILDKDGHICVK